jgi:hypothetical protein
MTKPKPKTPAEALIKIKGNDTWSALAHALFLSSGQQFNRGYLQQVVNGKRHASNKLLKALGLPLKAVPVVPCRGCGEVHLRKTCPHKRHPRPRTWHHLIDLTPQQVVHLLRTRQDYQP